MEQTKIEQIRSQMPVTQKVAYLNIGTSGPLPNVARVAMSKALDREITSPPSGPAATKEKTELNAQARAAFGGVINAPPEAIALTHSTGEALNIALWSLDWEPGDEVLTTNIEHSAADLPLQTLARRRNVVVTEVDLGLGEKDALEAFEAKVTSRTRMMVVSHVSYTAGATIPVTKLGELAQRRGLLYVIDGAQSVGAIPVDVGEIGADFYCVPGQKWLCGLEDVGALWVNLTQLDTYQQTFIGYRSLTPSTPGTISQTHADARRFEVGDRNVALLAGQIASIDWLRQDVGLEWAYRRIAHLVGYARDSLAQIDDLRVLTPAGQEAGLLSFTIEGLDPIELTNRLALDGFILRWIQNPYCVRVSCGLYNTEAEIDNLTETISRLKS